MKHALSDEHLEDLLRRDFVASTVPDDGFSARVLRALPARRPRRRWLLPAAATAGLALAWLSLLPAPLWQEATREWMSSKFQLSAWVVCALLLGVSLLGCAWALEEAE